MRDVRLPARRLTVAVAAVTALSLGLAACGGDEEEPSGGAEPEATGEVEGDPETWPLTGLEVEGDATSTQDHPVMVVKIDNTSGAQPQVGLGSADLVVEELVEGNYTRLATFFYSELPEEVGPVRSMRASDIGIVSPVEGVLVASGAAGPTIKRLNDSGVRFFQEGQAEGFRRDPNRSSLYSVMADLTALGKKASDDTAERPADYLPWGSAEDLPAGQPATSITADFGGHATSWTFEGGRYVNQNSFAARGDEFQPDTVLALQVEVVDAGYRDPAGNFVPESRFEGQGSAFLFHDGRVVKGTWKKKGPKGELTLEAVNGEELTVPAGKVWIELVPATDAGGNISAGRVTYKK